MDARKGISLRYAVYWVKGTCFNLQSVHRNVFTYGRYLGPFCLKGWVQCQLFWKNVCYCSWVSALTSLITALPDTPLLVPNLFHMWRRRCGLIRFGTLFQGTVCHKVENYVFVIQQRRFKQIRKLWDHVDFLSHCCVKGENNFERSPGTCYFFGETKPVDSAGS